MEREPLTKGELPTHWNSPELLPPVGSELLIKLGGGPYKINDTCFLTVGSLPVKAVRTAYIKSRGAELEYQLVDYGITVKGRCEWAYP